MTPWPRERRRRSSLVWILKLVTSLAILGYVFSIIPLNDIGSVLLGADLRLLVLGLLLTVPIAYAVVLQTKLLIDAQGVSFSRMRILEINMIASFYALFLPGYVAGGAIRWYKLVQAGGKPEETFAALAFNRIWETLSLVVLGGTLWLLRSVGGAYALGFGLLVSAGACMLVVLVLGRIGRRLWPGPSLRTTLQGDSGSTRSLRERLSRVLRGAAIYSFLPRGEFLRLIAQTFVRHVLGILLFVVFALAIGIELSLFDAGWVRSVLMLVLTLPITIAGLGVREVGLIVMLESLGVDRGSAVALSFVLLAREILYGLAGGMIEGRRVLGTRVR